MLCASAVTSQLRTYRGSVEHFHDCASSCPAGSRLALHPNSCYASLSAWITFAVAVERAEVMLAAVCRTALRNLKLPAARRTRGHSGALASPMAPGILLLVLLASMMHPAAAQAKGGSDGGGSGSGGGGGASAEADAFVAEVSAAQYDRCCGFGSQLVFSRVNLIALWLWMAESGLVSTTVAHPHPAGGAGAGWLETSSAALECRLYRRCVSRADMYRRSTWARYVCDDLRPTLLRNLRGCGTVLTNCTKN